MRIPGIVASVALSVLAACGGGGGSTVTTTVPTSVTATSVDNVAPVVVELATGGTVNSLFASVTVCAPGSSTNCQTIDHLLVDTASNGLRIMSSVMSPALTAALPQETDGESRPIVECGQFAGGYTWGPVRSADVRIAGEQALSLPVQVVGDPAFPSVPVACASTGPALNSVTALRANGILGVGVFREDCGTICATLPSAGLYYVCPPTGCVASAVATSQQVQNPVARFVTDNNGVLLQLPAVPDEGATTVSGSLIFGIGTHANNALNGATVFPVAADSGTFTSVYNGQTLKSSFVDSGSNAYFFPDSSIPLCATSPDFYCPPATLALSGTISGVNGTTATIDFNVANILVLIQSNRSASAFNNLAGPIGLAGGFDWGLPFYYGRNVYSAIAGAATPAGVGPYIAF